MRDLWLRTALLNFTIAALLGALLRLAFVVEIPWIDYRNVLHGHSHVAMLGWVYLALYALFISAFLGEDQARSPFYQRLFWLTQISVLGMLFSFPAQGYGPVSIAFSTLHILLSYAFAYRFLSDLEGSPSSSGLGARFARAALWLLVLSTLGTWALGPGIGMGMRGKIGFITAVQFFLHFQVFGWFLFGILALFFQLADRRGISFSTPWGNRFFRLLLSATFLTFGLVLTWAYPAPVTFGISGVGALLFFLAVGLLLRQLWPLRRTLAAAFSFPSRALAATGLGALVLASVLRALTVIPALATISYTLRNFMIAFLHLALLGVVSAFLLGYALRHARGKQIAAGALFFLTGFIGSELLLFGQGLLLWTGVGFIPLYYEFLFGFSALMPVGLFFFLFKRLSIKEEG